MQLSNVGEVSLMEATKSLTVVSRLFGMNPKSQWHKIYTVLILVFQFSLVYQVWMYHSRRTIENRVFNYFVNLLQDTCRVISSIVILGSGLLDRTRFLIPLKDFVNIDKSLKRLGARIDNRGNYRSEIVLFICVGLIPIFSRLLDLDVSSSIVTNDKVLIIFLMGWFYNFTIMTICAVADCSFSSTLRIIRKRFETINLIIRRAVQQELHLEINFLEAHRVNIENGLLRDLKVLRKQYHNLWIIGNRVNKTYGLHLLVGGTSSLVLITSKLWEIYITFENSYPSNIYLVAGSISWILFSVMRLLFAAQACESTVAEAKATSFVLQELGMKEDYKLATKAEIRDFFTQLQFEVRNFTACGFFNIDFTLVCGILGAACTYLVILIQMGDSNACVITRHFNASIHLIDKDH